MSLDWVAFELSKLFISLVISFKMTFLDENGKATADATCDFISSILGVFQIFLLHLTLLNI